MKNGVKRLISLFVKIKLEKIEKKSEKIWRIKKSPYLCSPFERKRFKKFIEKTEEKYKKQVPRNTIYREALISLIKEL